MLLRQIELSLFDLLLHADTSESDPYQILEQVRDEVALLRPPRWHRLPNAFTHIFAGGYAAGYYSYLWAELLAADAFREFTRHDADWRRTGERLRHEILAPGASRAAAESFRAFCGREADVSALLERRRLLV